MASRTKPDLDRSVQLFHALSDSTRLSILQRLRFGERCVCDLTDTLDADTSFEPHAPRETPIARMDLERAIERLPEGCREAFVLHDVEGFDHKEVAGLLDIAEGTSKSQVFKARAKLRGWLKK